MNTENLEESRKEKMENFKAKKAFNDLLKRAHQKGALIENEKLNNGKRESKEH